MSNVTIISYTRNKSPRFGRVAAIASLFAAGSVLVAATWLPQGPAPIIKGGNVDGLVDPINPQDGAVQAIAAQPNDSQSLYIGTVNGGVWKTVNGGATWTPLSDSQSSLSIGGLAFDPLDTNYQTIVVAIGRWSNSAEDGGPRSGLLYSINAGTNWVALGGDTLTNYNLGAVVARGPVLMVAANKSDAGPGGLFRSTDRGQTFKLSASGTFTALVGDPSDPAVFYTADCASGVSRTSDAGATWTNVFTTPTNYVVQPVNMNLAVGAHGAAVFLSIVAQDGKDVQVYFSKDQGGTWTIMDPPGSIENKTFYSPNPSGQGNNSSLAADPANPNLVFIGGDAQPFPGVSSGAVAHSGRLFRGNASAASGSQWTYLTGNFTTNSSAPHADSRAMVFDAAGILLESDDGGIYLRTAPQSTNGGWLSLMGNLQATEMHSVAYDRLTRTLLAGNQDNGASTQNTPGGLVWTEVSSGDGGKVAVNNISSTNFSVRYYSSQNLGGLSHEKFDSSNTSIDYQGLNLMVGGTNLNAYAKGIGEEWAGDPTSDAISFFPTLTLNRVDPTRIAIGTQRIYIGVDNVSGPLLDTVTLTDLSTDNFASETTAIAWGHPDNPNLMLVAAAGGLYLTTASTPGSLVQLTNYTGSALNDVLIHPASAQTFFVTDGNTVWKSTDTGASWTDIGAGLKAAGLQQLHTLQFISGNGANALLVAGLGGFYASLVDASPTVWFKVGDGLPNAVVWDSKYDAVDDLLVAATLGRGAWTLSGASAAVFGPSTPQPTLHITLTAGNSVQITWQGTGHLEQAPTVLGPWSVTGGAAGTFAGLLNPSNTFFRVVIP